MARKLICGIGFNDADYRVRISGKRQLINGNIVRRTVFSCPFYDKWQSMIFRCYSEKNRHKNPTYKDCSVCDEWLTFSNFKAWMEKQDWQGKHLDKDLISPGNKIYSPDKCCFLAQNINNFICFSAARKGEWPLGVSWVKSKGKFKASISDGMNNSMHIGYFNNPADAHCAWRDSKIKIAKKLAAQVSDERISKALLDESRWSDLSMSEAGLI